MFEEVQNLAVSVDSCGLGAHGFWMRRTKERGGGGIRPKRIMLWHTGVPKAVNWRDKVFGSVEELWTGTLEGYRGSSVRDLIACDGGDDSGRGGAGGGKLKRIALWCDESTLPSVLDEIEDTFFTSPPSPSSSPSSQNPNSCTHLPPAISGLSMLVLHVRSRFPEQQKQSLARGEGLSWMDVFRTRVAYRHPGGLRAGAGSETDVIDLLREEKFFVVPVMTSGGEHGQHSRTGRMEWKSIVQGGGGGVMGDGDVWTRAREWRALVGEGYRDVMPSRGGRFGTMRIVRDPDYDEDEDEEGSLLLSPTLDNLVPFYNGQQYLATSLAPLHPLLPSPITTTTTTAATTTTTTTTPHLHHQNQTRTHHALHPASEQHPHLHNHHQLWSQYLRLHQNREERLRKMVEIWEGMEREEERAREEGWFRGGEWELECREVEWGGMGDGGGHGGNGGYGGGGGGGGAGGRGDWGTDTREWCRFRSCLRLGWAGYFARGGRCGC